MFQTIVLDYGTDTITAIYESPITVVLSSEYGDVLWSSVDLIKKDGFKLEGFILYATEAGLSSGSSIHTTVVMSKWPFILFFDYMAYRNLHFDVAN